MKIIIIGGVAGGATAAARIRRLDENAEIIIFERSGYISYANCGLPYYIGGIIKDKEDLTLQTPEGFYRRFRIKAKVGHEVTDIDAKNKIVSVTDLKTGTSFTESYDKLILSPVPIFICTANFPTEATPQRNSRKSFFHKISRPLPSQTTIPWQVFPLSLRL